MKKLILFLIMSGPSAHAEEFFSLQCKQTIAHGDERFVEYSSADKTLRIREGGGIHDYYGVIQTVGWSLDEVFFLYNDTTTNIRLHFSNFLAQDPDHLKGDLYLERYGQAESGTFECQKRKIESADQCMEKCKKAGNSNYGMCMIHCYGW